MSKPKTIELKFVELMEASPVLNGLLARDENNNLEIHHSNYNPVGNRFPQLCFDFDYDQSEEVLPAEKGRISVTAFINKSAIKHPGLICKQIIEEVENIINKLPQKFNEINNEGDDNYGLRVVRCVRLSRVNDYDATCECYYERSVFEIVKDDHFASYKNDYGSEDSWWP